MTETSKEAEVLDTKAVVKPKKKKPAPKLKGKTYSAVHVDEHPGTKNLSKLVRVKLNFDTVNPEIPPVFDKATGSFSLTYDNIIKRGDVVEVPSHIAKAWVESEVPMGFKGWGFTDGMEPQKPMYMARAEYV